MKPTGGEGHLPKTSPTNQESSSDDEENVQTPAITLFRRKPRTTQADNPEQIQETVENDQPPSEDQPPPEDQPLQEDQHPPEGSRVQRRFTRIRHAPYRLAYTAVLCCKMTTLLSLVNETNKGIIRDILVHWLNSDT